MLSVMRKSWKARRMGTESNFGALPQTPPTFLKESGAKNFRKIALCAIFTKVLKGLGNFFKSFPKLLIFKVKIDFHGRMGAFLALSLGLIMLFTALPQMPLLSAAEAGEVLAEWAYTSAPGTSKIPATDGVFGETAVLTNFKDEAPDYSTQSLRIADWTGGGDRYWMVELSSAGYENLTLSNDQRSSGTAPRDCMLQYSLDAEAWTDITAIQPLSTGLTTVLDEFDLPETLDDQETIYLRWLVVSETNVNGYENDIRSGGTSNINNITVAGDGHGMGGDPSDEPQTLNFTVLATSDIHGRILNYDYNTGTEVNNYGLVKAASYIKSQRAAHENMIVIDNGDTFQGTPMSLLFLGAKKEEMHPAALALRYIGYDGWVLGNHEFNYGMDTLNKFRQDLEQPRALDGYRPVTALSANVYNEETDEPYAAPYMIKTFAFEDGSDVNVGVLALTTPNIPSWESSKNYAGLYFGGSFADGSDLAKEAEKWIAVMKADGADIIVASVHSGIERMIGSSNESQVRGMIAGTEGIDAVICGHSHSPTGGTMIENKNGEAIAVVNPGSNGSNVSQLDFTVEKGEDGIAVDVATKNVPMNNNYGPVDAALNELLAPYQQTALDYNNTVIGEAGEAFPQPSITEPSALVDIVHYAQMAAAPDAQVSITAPLSTRVTFEKGPLSVKDAGAAYIYENTLYVIKMTGANIKGWMELVASRYRADGSFSSNTYNADSLYGMSYDIDLTAPEGARVKNLRYEGKRVQPEDSFNVAVNNYRFAGEYMTAAGLTPDDQSLVVWESTAALGSDEGQVRSMVINYIKEKGIVYPEIKSDWTLSKTPVEETDDPSELALELSASRETAAGSFEISAALSEAAQSNVATLNFEYDTEKMDCSEIIAADDVEILSAEKTPTGVKILLMKRDYAMQALATLKMFAAAPFGSAGTDVTATATLVLKDENGNKTETILTDSMALNDGGDSDLTADLNGDGIVDLLDLSMIIDAFGIDDTHTDWNGAYKRMDFNHKDGIDINDIVYVARQLGASPGGILPPAADCVKVVFTKEEDVPVARLAEAANANLNAHIEIVPSEDEAARFSKKGILFCAAVYDADGRLFDLLDVRGATDEKGVLTTDIAIDIPEETAGMSYRLFIWDAENYEPLAEIRLLD